MALIARFLRGAVTSIQRPNVKLFPYEPLQNCTRSFPLTNPLAQKLALGIGFQVPA
jgi:hypothetical protein